ncbi:MAG: metallophosphoesterase family protein [Ferruginibacter sp.]
MKKQLLIGTFVLLSKMISAQDTSLPAPLPSTEMVFVSDTQQPLFVEKILLKPNNNLTATADIFSEILQRKPQSLYMLGDVVGLGYSNKKWRKVDKFLDSCRKININVSGILGNHEVMIFKKKGERKFDKRFPTNVRTGYVSITDSVAVILLNSNFAKLSTTDQLKQREWYEHTLVALDTMMTIKIVIVTCHHAPYSNSKVVEGSALVQQYFVPGYIKSKKSQLFITGHAHAFEHFMIQGKDFLVIGGGGGLHQPLNSNTTNSIYDLSPDYKPMFHYLTVQRIADKLLVTSHYLKENFSGFAAGHSFQTLPGTYARTSSTTNLSN